MGSDYQALPQRHEANLGYLVKHFAYFNSKGLGPGRAFPTSKSLIICSKFTLWWYKTFQWRELLTAPPPMQIVVSTLSGGWL
jgi:hypothetical protein